MIKWCSFCQQFQGEVPPFEKTDFTHGMCAECSKLGLSWSPEQEKKIKYLVGLNKRFWAAGLAGDSENIALLTDEALSSGIRAIDILYGIAAPALVRVGTLWMEKNLSIEDEQRFTKACETVVDVIAKSVKAKNIGARGNKNKIMLANVEGNIHFLGLRFVSIGLLELGLDVEICYAKTRNEILMAALDGRYRLVGLSISNDSQGPALIKTIESFLEASFGGVLLVGGAAVNSDLIAPFASKNVRLMSRPLFSSTEWQDLLRLD